MTTKTSATALSISALLFGVSLASTAYLAPQAKKGQKSPAKPAAGAAQKPGAKLDVAALTAAGKKIYDANGCAVCHAIGGKGGQAGPDLTKTGGNPAHTAKWFEVQVNNPKAHTAGSTMPAYEGKIKGKDLVALTVFLTTLGGSATAGSTGAAAAPIKFTPPTPAVIAKIEKSGGSVRQIAMSDPRLEIDFHLTGASVTDAALVPLAGMKGVLELNLGKTSVTDAGLTHIKGLTDLTSLHLEGTKITDRGLVHLKGMKNLVYLNVYNTAVTDEGLNQLTGLANLRQLYVWQTKVTKAGADKLKTALPKVEVVLGWDTADVKPPEVKK